MNLNFQSELSAGLYVRNPDSTELGKKIVRISIQLIYKLGYEDFTFKKLAAEIPTTEASIYRYFENKHKLLIYLVDLYWSFIEFQVLFHVNNLEHPEMKIKKIIDLLVWEDNTEQKFSDLDQKALYYIAVAEGSKTYLSKNVDENNKEHFFKPYKDLCGLVAAIFKEYNPDYPYAKTLASSLIELSHYQYFFMHHLPRLCDFAVKKDPKELESFLEHLIFRSLKP